jgi:hypothetical protein
MAVQARFEGIAVMIARNLESRIVKLETSNARPNEMLVVWRKPNGDLAEALKGATYTKSDKVICAEWFDDSPLPAPRWHANRPRLSMSALEDEQLHRAIERMAKRPEREQKPAGYAPFPSFTEERMKQMTDAELIHAILGVET